MSELDERRKHNQMIRDRMVGAKAQSGEPDETHPSPAAPSPDPSFDKGSGAEEIAWRIAIAKSILTADDGGDADGIFAEAEKGHDGDCTGVSHTCCLCQRDHYLILADAALAVINRDHTYGAARHAAGRREGLEEAARYHDREAAYWRDSANSAWHADMAADIRALAPEPVEGPPGETKP